MNEYVLRFRGIQFAGCFGTSKKERSKRQIIIVDVDLDLPFEAIAKRDRRSDVVDYDLIVRVVVDEGSIDQVQLLETYVNRVVDRLFASSPALKIRVAARKLRAPTTYPVDQAIVEILRERPGASAQG